MAKPIDAPRIIEAAGNKPKRIEEFIGRVNSATDQVSIAAELLCGLSFQ